MTEATAKNCCQELGSDGWESIAICQSAPVLARSRRPRRCLSRACFSKAMRPSKAWASRMISSSFRGASSFAGSKSQVFQSMKKLETSRRIAAAARPSALSLSRPAGVSSGGGAVVLASNVRCLAVIFPGGVMM